MRAYFPFINTIKHYLKNNIVSFIFFKAILTKYKLSIPSSQYFLKRKVFENSEVKNFFNFC